MLLLIVTTPMAVVVAVLAVISPNLWWVYLIFGACLLLLFFVLPRFVKNTGHVSVPIVADATPLQVEAQRPVPIAAIPMNHNEWLFAMQLENETPLAN